MPRHRGHDPLASVGSIGTRAKRGDHLSNARHALHLDQQGVARRFHQVFVRVGECRHDREITRVDNVRCATGYVIERVHRVSDSNDAITAQRDHSPCLTFADMNSSGSD
jgi:hypothetical protein